MTLLLFTGQMTTLWLCGLCGMIYKCFKEQVIGEEKEPWYLLRQFIRAPKQRPLKPTLAFSNQKAAY